VEAIEKKQDGVSFFLPRVKKCVQVVENKGVKISLFARGECKE
jgi:hypothetical protein